MASVGTASLDLVVDKQQVGRSITGAVKGAEPHAFSAAKGIGKVFGAAFAAAGAVSAVDLIGDAVNGARDLAENQSKVNTVFKEMGPAVSEYAKAADAIGLSDNAALEAVGTFGNLFDQLGIGAKQSAKMSTSLTDLAADLASFHNADITDVIDAQTAAFRGEYDSLQRFIPTINAAAVEQAALAATGKKTTKELTAQEKAIAVQKLMLEGAGAAMGDFARTSGGLANQQRILSARWEDAKATLGRGLLPVITAVTGFLAKNLPGAIDAAVTAARVFFGAFRDPDNTTSGFLGTIEKMGVGARMIFDKYLKPAAAWLKDNWKTALKIAGAAFLLFTGPVTFVVAALALLYVRFKVVREAVALFAGFIRNTLIPAVQAVAGFIVDKFGEVVDWFKSIWPQVSEAVGHVMNVVGGIIRTAVDIVMALWRAWGDDLLRTVKTIWNFIQETIENALQIVKGIIKFVLAVINGDWGKAWDALKQIVGGVWDQIGNVISTAFGVIRSLFGGFVSTISEVWSGLWNGLKDVVGKIWDGIASIIRYQVNLIIDAINLVIKAYNLLPGHKDIKEIQHLIDKSPDAVSKRIHESAGLASYDEGGWVKAPFGRPQLAIVHGGEYVLSHDEVSAMRSRRGGMGVVVNMSGTAGELLVEAGRDVVDGLVWGIKSRFANAATAAGDLATKVSDPVRKMLGLGSPSKVFHQYGEWTVDGFIAGVRAKRGALEQAMNDVFGDYVQAEDGSWVPKSFYETAPMVQAEDMSWVPASFYDDVDLTPVQRFAEGGWVKGPYGKAQLAVVHGGERVLSHQELAALRGGAGWTINVPLSGVVGNDRAVAQRVIELLTDYFKGGRKPPWLEA